MHRFGSDGWLLAFAVGLAVVPAASGQTDVKPQSAQVAQATDAKAAEFEVATIRPSRVSGSGIDIDGDRVEITGMTVRELACFAYGIMQMYCSGGDGWVSSDRFDINAKIDEAEAKTIRSMPSKQQNAAYRAMVPSLLRDRFKLQVKLETKELPVYARVVAKGGLKLTPAVVTPGAGSSARGGTDGTMRKWTAKNETMDYVAESLTDQPGVQRMVVDETGLKGGYDFELKWQRESAAQDTLGPSIFTALEEQLGLKLVPKKGPVNTLVVEHVERPSEN
jgi:bla regulator protein BlaR1